MKMSRPTSTIDTTTTRSFRPVVALIVQQCSVGHLIGPFLRFPKAISSKSTLKRAISVMSLLVKSPGDGSTIATVKQTPMSELDTIGKRAKDAAKVWKKTSIAERQAICR